MKIQRLIEAMWEIERDEKKWMYSCSVLLILEEKHF